jgi:serine phosphatase RsbU (regulator of sigma subunit)
LLVPATGEAGFFGGALGAPLGALGFAHCEQVVLEMQPGDLLFFYTDGLVERRGVALDDGMAELEAAVLEGPTDDVDQLCVRVIDASADTGDDDVAVLVIRRDP